MRFIIIYELKDFRERQENIWLLPSSMINHDFRQGPLVPNTWFPAWCKLGFVSSHGQLLRRCGNVSQLGHNDGF